MPSDKIIPIKYTSRDFNSIKSDLVEYAKRYYSDTFRDFNEASFGSLMLDTVAYVGDILSFYVDYQANESFLDTALQYDNVVKLARQLGYRFRGAGTSFGSVALYVKAPADSTGLGPDSDYLPIMRKGSVFSSIDGVSYILNENVDFSDSDNEIVVSDVDSDTGLPTTYAIRAYGRVISGELVQERVEVGKFERFLKVLVPGRNIAEVISVSDTQGHQYFEVENLSQNVVFVEVDNKGTNTDTVKNLMKPIIVPRRFVVEVQGANTFLQFGYGSEENLRTNLIADPSDVALKVHGKNYVSDTTFDPSKLTKTDKFGVAPAETNLVITYRKNNINRVNAASNAITKVVERRFTFPQQERGVVLSTSKVQTVVDSAEVTNHEPIVGDTGLPNPQEIKIRAYNSFSTQNRAVTLQDYKSVLYSMPPNFGSVKRVSITQDPDSFKRNLNLYVISEDVAGKLVKTNSTIKKNIKTWVTKYKMVNDTIDILDPYILNVGISYTAVSRRSANKFDVLASANLFLKSYVARKVYDIGENFYISDIYSVLKAVPGVLDVITVEIDQKNGAPYSNLPFDIDSQIEPDGRYIEIPKNVIIEIKLPDTDIVGTIR